MVPQATLTIAYITSRKEPHFNWFFDSLRRECKGDFSGIKIVVVDFFADAPERMEWISASMPHPRIDFAHVCPKPTVWQGKHRLTRQNWFAAANARNTALCLAPDGGIAYVDDLSVLVPGWLKCVRAALDGPYVVCGAYRKVHNLVVEDGRLQAFLDAPDGLDTRMARAKTAPQRCIGECLFGCSVAGPVRAFLEVNGWPEDLCDGMGYEDVTMGRVLHNAGWDMRYDKRMLTYEEIEGHFVEEPFRRADYGKEPDDKSHSVQRIAGQSKRFDNPSIPGGIAALRRETLAGRAFPVREFPEREWFSGTPLKDL